jgi:uncharacterized protein YndB with AHSA1/START domain
MLRAPEPVLMLIADITGYTTYLAGTEIDHAQNVLEDLLETVVAKLAPPFTVIKGEGDAVFLFAPGGSVSGTLLLDALDSCYFGFRRRLRDVTQATSCECNACVLIPRLDLKFVVHAGQAVRQATFGMQDLVGSDVIMVHRLLKNHVVEQHGWRGYALLTEPAVAAAGLDCMRLGMIAHREVYEDAGQVVGFVEDLDARWREEQDRAAVRLTREQAWGAIEVDMAARPPVVWEYATNPRLRRQWQIGVTRLDQENPDGRPGVGTTNHCVHGKEAILEEVLEYQPFESATLRSTTPAGKLLTTWLYVPTETGTHLTVLAALEGMAEPNEVWHVAGPIIEGQFRDGLTNLAQILEAESERSRGSSPVPVDLASARS